jgi:hypothetical protein
MTNDSQIDPAVARWFFLDGDNDRMHDFRSKYEALQKTGPPYAENYREGWESMDRDIEALEREWSERKIA